LKKGKLNFQGMLLGMGFGKKLNLFPSLHDLVREFRIDGNDAERGSKTSSII